MPIQRGDTLLDRYDVEELLGEGAMGQVWRAWDRGRASYVALKAPHAFGPDRADLLESLKRERDALQRLRHQNIVPFYDFEEDGGAVFLVLEYIHGQTLADRIAAAGGRLDLAEMRGIARQICSALEYAHYMGWLHRDVKPGNILVSAQGRAYLSDFGTARWDGSAVASRVVVGSRAYLAPERWNGQDAVRATDLYALGVTLYEMLAGRRPFLGVTAEAPGFQGDKLRDEHLHVVPRPLADLNPLLPDYVVAAIHKCLAKDPEQRYQSAADLLRDLEGGDERTVRLPGRLNAPPAKGWRVLAGDSTAPGQFNSLGNIAVDTRGNVYVADTGNHRIQKLASEGESLAQ